MIEDEDDYKYDFGLYDFEIDIENYDLLPQSKNETRYIKPKINKLIKDQYLKYEYAEEKLLGHSEINMTLKYLRYSDNELKTAIKKLNTT